MTVPNIVLLLTDDQSYESLQRNPTIFRRLAAAGVQFTSYYVACSLCQPQRATILTGQYPHNHGVVANDLSQFLALDHTTMLPKRLQVAGYKTAFVGKYLNAWDVTMAIPIGWDDWHGTSPELMYNYSINDNGVTTAIGAAPTDYHTNVVAGRAVSFIAAQNGNPQPFFMQVGFRPSHFDTVVYNVIPHPSYLGVVPGSRQFPRAPNWNPALLTGKPAYISGAPLIGAPEILQIDAAWRAETEALFSLDVSVGLIMDALIAAGKSANTVVILTSDNGYMHGEFRVANQKFVPYEPSIHVPLIVSGPAALVVQNKTCSQLASGVDIAATIYALSGAVSTRQVDGVSLAPLLLTPTGPALRNNLIIEWLGTGVTGVPKYTTIRSPYYKYTEYLDTGEKELYNLSNDPWEITNLVGQAVYAATQAQFAALVASAKTCSGSSCII